MHTRTVDKSAGEDAVDSPDAAGWKRLGEMVREARMSVGFTNREDFAEACNISVRVLADFEAGKRTNFSERVLSRLEAGLGWPPGTVDQAVFDENFVPPKSVAGGNLLFRPPAFDRQPVQVEVVTVEKTISLLTEISRERAASKSKVATDAEAVTRLGAAAIALCWPYVIRLVEDNCLPGNELHPSVRPVYEAFLAVQTEFAPDDNSGRYARWLAGDESDVPDPVRRRYMERWSESRRVRPGRRSASEADD